MNAVSIRVRCRAVASLSLLLFVCAVGAGEPRYVDAVRDDKADRRLYLLQGGDVVREYVISLGDAPVGHKRQRGDERTPEGTYTIDYRNPKSRYHLSLHITYPNPQDRQAARRRGVNPGGDIFIHGLPNGMEMFAPWFRRHDWTDGCIAVDNEAIEEIWQRVRDGTPIEIRP